jgi:peptide/nickel transport system ATP-binding protein
VPPADRRAAGGELLTAEDLAVSFRTRRGPVEAVRGVSFTLTAGECLAIVGESGSGKSVTARALVGLAGPGARVRAARLALGGLDLTRIAPGAWRELRGGRIGLVLQDALAALDPLRTVGAEITETLRNHHVVPRAQYRERTAELLEQVRVPDPGRRAGQRPYELSGGQRQRALIASALAAEPEILVADEPTTALDVTVQAQLLDLLADKQAAGTAILLISHDLAVVARLADRIAVMHQGVFVEQGPAAAVLGAPAHPYTRRLLAAVPATHPRGTRLGGAPPAGSATGPAGDGCRYAPSCPLAADRCRTAEPAWTPAGPDHEARCWRTADPWPAPPPGRARGPRRAAVAEVIAVAGVAKSYAGDPAVTGVSFELRAGETLGVVGESGSGKTTLANLVLGLTEPDAGSVTVLGEPWSGQPEAARRARRRRIQLVQQDPLSSFDPRYPVARIIGEALGAAGHRASRRQRPQITALLAQVGLGPALLDRRPAQLSGGQRQRVAIARALAREPSVLVCDEPTSALDVSVQAQILDLFTDLQDELGLALLFISHDLGVVRHVSDRVLVMLAGAVVEQGGAEEIFARPAHSYTRSLLAALPAPAAVVDNRRYSPYDRKPAREPSPLPALAVPADPVTQPRRVEK